MPNLSKFWSRPLAWAALTTVGVVICAAPVSAQSQDRPYSARVSYIFDGDTLWVRPSDGGRSRKLRIEGIDAPEICQKGGEAARDALRARLSGQVVTVTEHQRDAYGRPLIDLALGGENMGAWMVEQGWAWSYRWHADDGPYAREERVARSSRRGLFAEPSAEEPRDFRRRFGPCPRGK